MEAHTHRALYKYKYIDIDYICININVFLLYVYLSVNICVCVYISNGFSLKHFAAGIWAAIENGLRCLQSRGQ